MENPQIKLKTEVYDQLELLREKGQTFSMVIEDLLQARLAVLEMLNLVEGALRFRQWQHEQLHKLDMLNATALKSKEEKLP